MISYEEVEMEKDLRNRKIATEEIEKAKVFAEKEDKAKAEYAKAGQVAPIDFVTSVKEIKDLTVVMFSSLVHDDYTNAEKTLYSIMDRALEATRAGQKNADKVARHAHAALKVYRNWPGE